MTLNPNKVTAALHLDVTSAEAVGFTLQTNSTVSSAQRPHSMQTVDILICSYCTVSASLDEADGIMRHVAKVSQLHQLLHFTLTLVPAAQIFQGQVPGQLDHV